MKSQANTRPLTFQVTLTVMALALFTLLMVVGFGAYATLRADEVALQRQTAFALCCHRRKRLGRSIRRPGTWCIASPIDQSPLRESSALMISFAFDADSMMASSAFSAAALLGLRMLALAIMYSS